MSVTRWFPKRVILAALLASWTQASLALPNVIFDHDGGVDDYVALTLLACSPKVNLEAITFQPGDSYKETGLAATHNFLAYFGRSAVTVGASDFEGRNPFPHKWRSSAAQIRDLPMLPPVNDQGITHDAPRLLVELLSGTKKYTIVAVGPLSNIAEALRIHPSIKNNIERLVVMGGAVFTDGNVLVPGHDGSAEWNIFNAPEEAAFVLSSGIPVSLVPLDATNAAPMRRDFVDRLAQQASPASGVVFSTLQVIKESLFRGTFHLWDAMTVMSLLEPGLVTNEPVAIKVLTESVSQGRTLAAPDGQVLEVATGSDGVAFENSMLDLLQTCEAANF